MCFELVSPQILQHFDLSYTTSWELATKHDLLIRKRLFFFQKELVESSENIKKHQTHNFH